MPRYNGYIQVFIVYIEELNISILSFEFISRSYGVLVNWWKMDEILVLSCFAKVDILNYPSQTKAKVKRWVKFVGLGSWISFWFSWIFKELWLVWCSDTNAPPYNLHTYLQFVPFDLLINAHKTRTINSDLPGFKKFVSAYQCQVMTKIFWTHF